MEMNFCRRCSAKLSPKSLGLFVCENGHSIFQNPAPTSCIFFVTDDKQVMLAVRGRDPNKGMLDAPGGFVDINESLEEALSREMVEELGLHEGDYEPPEYLGSASSDYSFGGENHIVVSAFYSSKLKPGIIPVPQDDVADIRMVPLTEINFDEISGGDTKAALQMLQKTFL